jgi:hypothetical protein
MPWDEQPFVDHKAAARRAIAAAQRPHSDPNSPAAASYAQHALDGEEERLSGAPDGTRNMQLFKSAANLFELVAAGALDEPVALDALRAGARACGYEQSDGVKAVEATIASGRRRGMDNPRDLTHVGTKTNGFRLDTEPVQSINLDTVTQIERGFWTQRESLQDIYLGALSRMCSPWAVLGFCAARVLALVRPNCVLPPLIGGPGSLNWFCAIAAPSGGGKGSAGSAAKELVKEYVLQRNLGSGEGIVDAYVKPADKINNEPAGLHESVMFVADEIDTMHALGSRAGSTLPAILRSGFSGEPLGFSYRQASKLHLAAQTYRMTLAVSVQPARAGALMDDSQGGTLQRFMWFPGVDSRVTADIPLMPGSLELPPFSAWQYPRELKIPYEAVELIRDERSRAMRGENDVVDGHALFIREKFAYALAVLDGRDEMSLQDWVLAGIASRVSDHTRTWVAAQLDQLKDDDATERGRLQGVSSNAADEEKSFRASQRTNRIASWALKKVASQPVANRDLSRAVASKDRPYLPAALVMLQNAGLVEQDDQKRWCRVRA